MVTNVNSGYVPKQRSTTDTWNRELEFSLGKNKIFKYYLSEPRASEG
jgi:hypothetical protein